MSIEAQQPLVFDADGLLQDLSFIVAEAMVQFVDLPVETAEAIAQTIAEEVAERWGGVNLYVPKGWRAQAKRLHLQIYEEFNGRNQVELALKHHVSVQWVYRVVKRLGDEDKARRQSRLID